METHADVLNLWPTGEALAKDVGMKATAVRHWRRTGRIPPYRYDQVIEAAKRRGFKGVTYALLAEAGRR